MKGQKHKNTVLAWARWRVNIPPDWRPIEILGGLEKGKVFVGDADSPVLQIKWSRTRDAFNPDRWIARRAGRKVAQGAAAPAPEGFRVLDWQPEAKTARKRTRSIWAGWSKRAGLLIEAVVFALDRPSVARRARVEVLPSLTATPPDEPAGWAVFETSFRTPPGFDCVRRNLRPGSMALLFVKRSDRLMLRQAYPREAALGRRDLAGWLRAEPFGQLRRKFYPAEDPQPWTVESGGRTLKGLIRRGRRKLPWPLGWPGRLFTVQAVVQDEQLDRLLLAEHSSRRDAGDAVVRDALAGMNWALFE
jgi:hypothetical protein